jgi:GntR family transcriptional regulator
MSDGMVIRVVLDGPEPVYKQIADAVRTMCVNGKLEPGMKLPSVRELAASLGIHFNTVAGAYRVLADEGWLSLEGRRGAIVESRSQPGAPNKEAQTSEGKRLRHLVAELSSNGFGQEWILRQVMEALEAQS